MNELNPDRTTKLSKNTIFNLTGWGWSVFLSLITTPFIIRKLGTEAYGIYVIVVMVTGYAGTFSGSLSDATVKFLAATFSREGKVPARRIVFMTQVLVVGLSLPIAILLFFAAQFFASKVFRINPDSLATASYALQLGALSFLVTQLKNTFRSVPIALHRFEIVNLLDSIIWTTNILFTIIVLLLGGNVVNVIAIQLIFAMVATICFAFSMKSLLEGFPIVTSLDSKNMNQILGLSSKLFANGIFSTLSAQVDKTIIAITLGASSLTYYAVPARLMDYVGNFASQSGWAFYPLSSELAAQGRSDTLNQIYLQGTRILIVFSTGLTAILAACSPLILRFWLGLGFETHSAAVMSILMASVLIASQASLPYHLCNGMGYASWNVIRTLLMLVFIGLGVITLAPKFGLIGAAAGYFSGIVLSIIPTVFYFQWKILKLNVFKFFIFVYFRPLMAGGLVFLIGFLIARIVVSFLGAVGLAIGMVVGYILLILALKVFDSSELKKLFAKIPFLRAKKKILLKEDF